MGRDSFLVDLDGETREALEEADSQEAVYAYQKEIIIRGINGAVSPEERGDFIAACGPFLKDPHTWGGGISSQMIRELKELGIDRARLTLPGSAADSGAAATDTAGEARKKGYLFGIYDSYHSIHNPALAGSDESWETAQMGSELYETGGIQRADGSYYTGFKGTGRRLNPLAARSFFQERVEKNLAELDLSFYFIDVDAAGEITEDFHPRHRSTSEEISRERTDRLRWLGDRKGLAVGSEGGSAAQVPGITVSEGVVSPVFYWEDRDFRKRGSQWYIGGYWPPEEPKRFFQSVPLKERFEKLYFDPAVRIPLYQGVFHDAVITTNHWESDMLKYQGMENRAELFQLLGLNAPLYNLNRRRLAREGERILENYRFFSPLHRRFATAALEEFSWLSGDRLVQKAIYQGGLTVVVNFSENNYLWKGNRLPALSCLVRLPEGEIRVYTPGA